MFIPTQVIINIRNPIHLTTINQPKSIHLLYLQTKLPLLRLKLLLLTTLTNQNGVPISLYQNLLHPNHLRIRYLIEVFGL